MNLSAYDLTHVLLFNENLIRDYKFESPFDLVESGKWTFDRMYEMMTKVSIDLNGDGVFDEKDQYGYVSYARVSAQNFWIYCVTEKRILLTEHWNSEMIQI